MNMLTSANARSHCKITRRSLACYATPAVNLSVCILLYRSLQPPHFELWMMMSAIRVQLMQNEKPTPLKQRGSCCCTNNICFAKDKRHFNSWTDADSYIKHDTDRIQSQSQILLSNADLFPVLSHNGKINTDDKPNTSWMQSCTCVFISQWQLTTLWYLYVKVPIFTSNED